MLDRAAIAAKIRAAQAELAQRLAETGGCTDGNCAVIKPSGMHTNGGCKCLRNGMKAQPLAWAYRAFAQAIAEIMAELEPPAAEQTVTSGTSMLRHVIMEPALRIFQVALPAPLTEPQPHISDLFMVSDGETNLEPGERRLIHSIAQAADELGVSDALMDDIRRYFERSPDWVRLWIFEGSADPVQQAALVSAHLTPAQMVHRHIEVKLEIA